MTSTTPVMIICTPMQSRRKADNLVKTRVPSSPNNLAIALDLL